MQRWKYDAATLSFFLTTLALLLVLFCFFSCPRIDWSSPKHQRLLSTGALIKLFCRINSVNGLAALITRIDHRHSDLIPFCFPVY